MSAPADQQPAATAESDSTTTLPVQPTTEPSSSHSQPAAPVDPFTALSSMWSGWLSPSTQTIDDPNKPTADATPANASNPAADLLSGAGKMWNDLGATLKDAAENVDTAKLGEQVTVIREQSGRFMEDVSRSVQQLNISLPSTESLDLSKSAEAISSSTRDFLDKASQSLEQGRKEALEIFVDADDASKGPDTRGSANLSSTNTNDLNSATNENSALAEGSGVNMASQAGYAPWDVAALPDGEKPHADVLRREMLKLVVDAIYSRKKRNSLFLSDVARKRGFQFDLERRANEAMAALEADKNMRRLRAGLVPGKMKEEVFWQTYFYHVHRIRQTLVANNGVMPETTPDEEEDEDDLFGDDSENTNGNGMDAGKTEPEPEPKVEEVVEKKAVGEAAVSNTAQKDESIGGKDEERNWEEDIEAAFKDDDE